MNVLRNPTVSVTFNSQNDTFSQFKKIQTFSGNLFIFSKKQNYFEHFQKTATFSCIPQQKSYLQSFQGKFIFLENQCTFLEQPKVWTFWEMLVFQLNSTAKMLPQANFYNFKIFNRKTHFFKFKKAWSLNFLRTVTISVNSTASLLPLPS